MYLPCVARACESEAGRKGSKTHKGTNRKSQVARFGTSLLLNYAGIPVDNSPLSKSEGKL